MNFSPSRSSTQGVTGSIAMGQRVGADRVEIGMLREPFERPPRRENEPRFAPAVSLEHFVSA